MRIQLPYAYEVVATHRGTREEEILIQRDFLVAFLRPVERRWLTPLFERGIDRGDRELTFGFDGRLYREIKVEGVSVTPRALEEHLLNTRPRRQARTVEAWRRKDFPRPPYVRCPLFEDRNALFLPPTELPFRTSVLDFSAKPSREKEARETYESDFITDGYRVWVAVPAPVYVLRQDRALDWHLRIEFQPTIWEAATTFSLHDVERAVRFADDMAFDLCSKDLAELSVLRAAGPEVPSIVGLAAACSAHLGRGFDCFWSNVTANSYGSARDLLDELGGPLYPWETDFNSPEALAKPQLLRRRWLFELASEPHTRLSDILRRGLDGMEPPS